ncbi:MULTISPECIES: DUF7551 domain-containing protein [Halorubrum]|uniref:Uncharacterized protein n=1 Tax=Halorubrum hochstenium ATCC 700873 TaxID=1227481 RepID=M0FH28_9EURY|nr:MULTISPECIES: hypothetical protein [Halorubrum]ELZ59351.1 hypothetical protein C467_03716 [Halorubrum hochstenium ATCC 700873]
MIGTTLLDIADHIESLAAADGEFSLVCARYGDRPVPAAGLRFDSRETARAAARATEQYRDALRRYDPRLPFYDVVVRQEFAGPEPPSTDERADDARRFAPPLGDRATDELSDRVVDGAAGGSRRGDRDGRGSPLPRSAGDSPERGRHRDRVEFCHAAAAATFEALSAGGHDRAESAVMDAYFALAERRSDPDDLCLCLLEAMATALERHLDPETQAAVLSAAADRLSDPEQSPAADRPSSDPDLSASSAADPSEPSDPVTAAFDRLAAVGLVDGYERVVPEERSPELRSSASDGGTVRVSGYALSPTDGRLPTLPVALAVTRRDPRGRPAGVALLAAGSEETGPDWRFRVAHDDPVRDGGPVTAPIPSEE